MGATLQTLLALVLIIIPPKSSSGRSLISHQVWVNATVTTNATAASVKPIAPTALLNSTDLRSFFTSYMQGQGFSVIIPFIKSVSNTTGNDQYTGTLTNG
jgi:hypothetical protein